MTQKDADLEQLRLIDDFLEEEIIDPSDSDAFNAEIRQAITAFGEAVLPDSKSVFENERDDAWGALFDAP
ncbi:hypothetical protein [Sphingomonas sp.]|uniref:hypothetical protein n=1 Tax=Sphingomonas sp. TaxID=28214 RepID=UPI0031CE5B56